MWDLLVEWGADLFMATARHGARALVTRVAIFALAIVVALVLAARFGVSGIFPVLFALAFSLYSAADVLGSRAILERALTLSLDDPRQPPPALHVTFSGPTASSLSRLAVAVDAARRGRYAEASELIPLVHRDLLRPEELRAVEAVLALVELGLDDDARAAQHAVNALPSGSEDIDARLGRLLLAREWHGGGVRLGAIDAAWERAGVSLDDDGALPRLRRLLRVRDAPPDEVPLSADETRALAEEARALGDDALAGELTARARGSRLYRD